jgi:hypothetical protein
MYSEYRKQASKIQANKFNSHLQGLKKKLSLLDTVTLLYEITTSM